MGISLFFLLLFLLFLLSRRVTRLLSRLFFTLFHSTSGAIYFLSFLFLPGVILHELSHLFMASILLVPTGQVEFIPEIHGTEVKMGSVAIAKTDPLRRFLIGIVPVAGGLGVIFLASFYLPSYTLSWQGGLLLYVIFEVANTMFSSSKDMEGALGFGIGIIILGIILQILGLHVIFFLLGLLQNNSLNTFFLHICIFLGIAVAIDGAIVLVAKGVSLLGENIKDNLR